MRILNNFFFCEKAVRTTYHNNRSKTCWIVVRISNFIRKCDYFDVGRLFKWSIKSM